MHTLSRRGLLTAAGSLPLGSLSAGLAPRSPAADKLTSLVLATPIPRITHGLSFARLLEYNLARHAPQAAEGLWSGLAPNERAGLAQAYATSSSMVMHERPPVLLDLLAQRLEGGTNTRIAMTPSAPTCPMC